MLAAVRDFRLLARISQLAWAIHLWLFADLVLPNPLPTFQSPRFPSRPASEAKPAVAEAFTLSTPPDLARHGPDRGRELIEIAASVATWPNKSERT